MLTVFVPPLVALAAAVAAWWFELFPTLGDGAAAMGLGGTIVSVDTTMLGFMLAALAIIASISHTHLVKMMQKTGHYKELLQRIFIGCVMFIVGAMTGFALLFGAPANPVLLSLLMGAHVGAWFSLLSIGKAFWLVLSNLKAGDIGQQS